MRFALIGCNDDAVHIASAIATSRSHSIASIHSADNYCERLSNLAPAAIWSEHWEGLLVTGDVDAVIVSRHADSLVFEDQCRKLVQAQVPIIAAHPLSDSLFCYELEMMREEVGGVILAFAPGFGHPAFRQVADLIAAGESSAIGVVEQLVIERHLPARDRASVLKVLAQDITLVRQLIGEITSINAVGAEPGDASLPNLSVNVTGTSKVIGRWSAGPATDDRARTITLVGSRGTAIVTAYATSQPWNLRIGSEQREFEAHDDTLAAIESLRQAIADRDLSAEWEAVCHDLDATEQIERSLRRKRTIEFRRDAQNEEGAFKGIMSAGSCLVLTLALFLLMIFAIVEGFRMPLIDAEAVRGSGEAVPRAHVLLRLWPVYPLAAFLLLQFLVFVAKKPKSASGEGSQE
jgi:predicted dehydrogenase